MTTPRLQSSTKKILLLVGLMIAMAAVLAAIVFSTKSPKGEVGSYQQCVDAGNPIQESYPERCTTPDGKGFTNPNASGQLTTLEGKVICLAHKSQDGPHTLECAIGLASSDGSNYSLSTDPQDTTLSAMAGSDKTVRVTGTIKTGEDSRYKSSGVLTVSRYEPLD